MRAAHLLRIGLHGALHRQRGIAGPRGMVLMRDRGAEQRHNAIAQDLVHRPFVAVYGVHHQMQSRVEELLRVLGVAVARATRGAFEVGKQHSDLLAFAFQGTAGGEDFLGQMGACRQGVRVPGCPVGRHTDGGSGRGGSGLRVARPDQAAPCVIDHLGLRVEQFVLQGSELYII